MSRCYVLYNPSASSGNGEAGAKTVERYTENRETLFVNMQTIGDYTAFFASISHDDEVIICGGDGTVNRFVNDTRGIEYTNKIFYYACGTGNDFLKDIGHKLKNSPIPLESYIENLPIAVVKGKTYYFVNNVGSGIDGYCTEIGDSLRQRGRKKINYTLIALGGMLGGFHPLSAAVTVDGRTYDFRNVWMSPVMNGRYFGGGMMVTPKQDRLNPNHTVTMMLYTSTNGFSTALRFPAIFNGSHTKFKSVRFFEGKDIYVKYMSPCTLQVDGETIYDVSEYEVHTVTSEKYSECIKMKN